MHRDIETAKLRKLLGSLKVEIGERDGRRDLLEEGMRDQRDGALQLLIFRLYGAPPEPPKE